MKTQKKNKSETIIWLTLIIILWEAAARTGLVNTYLLPPFSRVVYDLILELLTGKLGLQTLNSLAVVMQGFGISFTLAILIAVLCVSFPLAESLVNTICTIMNPLPSVAIMPLIIMWFGINMTSMLVIIVHGVLWALVRYMIDGIHAIPKIQIEWGRNIGLPPYRMFSGIMLYAIVPSLLAALRIGWGRAWRALISAEMVFGMIGSVGGVGYYIYISRTYARITNVFAGLIVVVIIGILIETILFSKIEKWTVKKWGMNNQ
jgi:NitT/TauT family transport system permease protein